MILTRIPLVLATIAVGLTTACSTTGPNNNENMNTGAGIGAGLGALAGIFAGDTPEERRRGAAVGAVLGGGIGGAIGKSLDRQEEELRQSLGGNTKIVNTGDSLVVTMPQDILFAVDSAALTGSLQNDLFAVARSLNNYPNSTVNVVGHTDNTGEAAYNFDLSQRRAQAVTSVLINAGVSPSRVRAIGRGEDQPIATNLTREGRQQNRRVEIVIVPN